VKKKTNGKRKNFHLESPGETKNARRKMGGAAGHKGKDVQALNKKRKEEKNETGKSRKTKKAATTGGGADSPAGPMENQGKKLTSKERLVSLRRDF